MVEKIEPKSIVTIEDHSNESKFSKLLIDEIDKNKVLVAHIQNLNSFMRLTGYEKIPAVD